MNRKLSETAQCGNLTTLYHSGAFWGVRGQTVIYSALDKIQAQLLMHRLFDQCDSSKNLSGWLPNLQDPESKQCCVWGCDIDWFSRRMFCPVLLVILYANLCRSTSDSKIIWTYANNTILVRCLHGSKNQPRICCWALITDLQLNILKTKDINVVCF